MNKIYIIKFSEFKLIDNMLRNLLFYFMTIFSAITTSFAQINSSGREPAQSKENFSIQHAQRRPLSVQEHKSTEDSESIQYRETKSEEEIAGLDKSNRNELEKIMTVLRDKLKSSETNNSKYNQIKSTLYQEYKQETIDNFDGLLSFAELSKKIEFMPKEYVSDFLIITKKVLNELNR